jgi:hypothetical protein
VTIKLKTLNGAKKVAASLSLIYPNTELIARQVLRFTQQLLVGLPDMLLLGRKRAEAFSRESPLTAKPHVNLRRE